MADRPPNILFLMSDEHRADAAGFAGDPIVRTPTLDWLASTGVVFRNAYTPSPICIPARQCMAAGQLPRTCGVERYGQDLPPFSMTFARRLSQFAYTTVCCGKLHHMGPDQMQGWTRRIGSNTAVDDTFLDGRDEASFRDAPKRHNAYGLRDKDVWEIQNAGVGRGSNTHVGDEIALLGARRFIENRFLDAYYDRHCPGRPTMLMVSFNRPHYPYLTTEDRFTWYLNRVRPFVDEPVFDHPFLSQRRVRPGVDVTERELQRATAAYYGMIDEVDADYRTILDTLVHAGQDLDDWVIVYCADHGEMLGEHGIWEKQKFFEASARVPLIIRWPRRFEPRVVDENVNLCDLFATLCDVAGVPLPQKQETVRGAGLDSRSLVPLMRGESREWRERFLDETVSQFGGTNLMIKRGPLKYQWYDRDDCRAPEHAEVLFDLEADPSERRNLALEPRYSDAMDAFRVRRGELGFGPGAAAYRNAAYAAAGDGR